MSLTMIVSSRRGRPAGGPDNPASAVEVLTRITHLAFMDGLHTAFTISAALAVVPIVLTFWIKAGRKQGRSDGVHV